MPHSLEQSSSSSSGTPFKKTPLQRASSSSISQQPRLRSPSSSIPDGGAKFPRIDECAHFHYEAVDCGRVELALLDEAPENPRVNGSLETDRHEQVFWVNVRCKGKEWVIRRVTQQFMTLDDLLHECVYDRKFTHLQNLDNICDMEDPMILHNMLKSYVSRLSDLPEDQMSCAPVLHWFDMDNKGTKLVAALRETADINIPAVAAAHTVRRYTAQSSDELSLEVGDMVSIIDMTNPDWWRGKCRLQVGSFPAHCVKRISDAKQAEEVPAAANLPSSPTTSSPPNLNTSRTKPIVKKHGKFMEFLRSFLITRPTKSRLKQSGILKERVFGCDLGEYLHNVGDDVPVVVKDCTEFVEKYGIVDGIYRISGVASHVQNLRHEYDCERRPDLNRDPSGRGEQSLCDPHSVAGLCKLFFRELPNPLLTYQLYNRFDEAINTPEEERLLRIHDVIQQLPPPHYRTLKHLALHLQLMSKHDDKTSMHCRNLAIVWAPNLLRSRDLEAGLAAFTEARVQSVVTEFLIANADILFSDQLQNVQLKRGQKPPRPKSLMVLSRPKLISLEEAQARSKAGGGFSISSGDNFASSIKKSDDVTSGVRRSRKMSSPPGYPHSDARPTSPTKPVVVSPVSAGSSSLMKRRQSMDPKLGNNRQQQQNFVTSSRPYSSQHSSSGWKSKLGSFLRKGAATPVGDGGTKDDDSTRVLRRSQSDDSLLSSHSTRQDDDDQSALKSLDSTGPVNPPSLRHGGSPRSPRPVGRIFLTDDHFMPTDTVIKQNDQDPVAFDFRSTPDSIPSPSVETNPSSHNPFSGLDSDFPGVMGESGLGFNPLQYSPTFSSDSGIPELPKSLSDYVLTEGHTPDQAPSNHNCDSQDLATNRQKFGKRENPARKSIGNLDEIRIPNNDSTSSTNEQTESELETLYLNSKIEDILNANVKIKELDTQEAGDNSGSDDKELERPRKEKSERLFTVTDVLSQSRSENQANIDNSRREKISAKEKVDEYSPKSRRSYYWKTEEIDRLSEVDKPSEQENDENVTKLMRHEKHSPRRKPNPYHLPESGNYSVQYACSQHQSNGRTRQSITATFVQDRPLDSRIRRPHSIRRSMDVPPPDVGQSTGAKRLHGSYHARQHKSVHDFTRSHKAYAAWVSQHQREVEADAPTRVHYRSLSTGDELHSDEVPVPAPRPSLIKPTPAPRQSLLGRHEKHNKRNKRRDGGRTYSRAMSAPSTPVDAKASPVLNEINPSTKRVSECLPTPAIEAFTYSGRPGADELQQTERKYPKPAVKTKSASGIVSPSDNVCASTVLSWV